MITPSAQKIRQCLALLLLNANRVTPSASLMEELWAGSPPPSDLTTLRTYVYHLRKTLLRVCRPGQGEVTLTTRTPGYLLRIDPRLLDVTLFEDHLARGRSALESGDLPRASGILAAGGRLWTGPALVDVGWGTALEAQAARLEELRMTALALRIEADLKLGRHHELVAELRWLVACHPLNEWLYGRLMEALSRSGRRGEALAVYRKLRSVLADQLGLEPSAELSSLQQAILGCPPPPAAEGRQIGALAQVAVGSRLSRP
ncbi:AfsR/SARP family transcriptional regulator [Wenjunlia tyrosinilytica]|uniref:AfsR/SARP family transcriptional regulator n=1 Tax=Wenjunlia tyrosinilytica TaxID=1544741 RepID=UPI001E3A42DD|nr:AfsR/SARP family transcriptional regulator [Wenjunlia tyrosinilytica]